MIYIQSMFLALALLMHCLSPHLPVQRIAPIAYLVSEATDNPREQSEMIVVSFFETNFGTPRSIPFGLSAVNTRGKDLKTLTRISLNAIRSAQLACGKNSSIAVVLGRYHSGRCVADNWSRSEARMVETAELFLETYNFRARMMGFSWPFLNLNFGNEWNSKPPEEPAQAPLVPLPAMVNPKIQPTLLPTTRHLMDFRLVG